MYCTDCGSRNPNDSKFCRECGRKILTLDDEARLSASRDMSSVNVDLPEKATEPERLRQLLDMAFWHNEAGNLSGSVMACEAALKLDPNSTTALSLLGCLYEKLGDDAKAINAFERVVQLNPESTADYDKLENLLRGIRHKAVNPSLVHQLTPPVLLRAARKYPSLPAVAAIVAGVFLLTIGIKAVWDHFAPPSKAAQVSSNSTPNGIPSIASTYSGSAAPSVANAIPNQFSSSQPAAAPIQPQYRDPFGSSAQPPYSEMSSRNQGSPAQYQEVRHDGNDDSSGANVPSYNSLRPLTVPASSVPAHTDELNVPQVNNHVVEINPPSSGNNPAPDSSSDGDSQLPAPPPSHIFVTVHGGSVQPSSNESSPAAVENESHAISLRENAGASLQQKAINMQDAGNYKAAAAAYQGAIAAYQSDISAGRAVQEAKSGIDTCKVALEICKQSQ